MPSFVAPEHPQTIALIVSALSHTPHAVKLLKELPEDCQPDISYRILHRKTIQKTISMEIIKVLIKQLEASGAMAISSEDAGINSFVKMLMQSEGDDVSTILASLETTNEGSASDLLSKVHERLKAAKSQDSR